MDSILNSVKKLLGISSEYDAFDTDIIICVNTAIDTLSQLGVSRPEGFEITGPDELWSDYLPDQNEIRNLVKTYIFTKTKLQFDPPTSNVLKECLNAQLDEYTFRINAAVDHK